LAQARSETTKDKVLDAALQVFARSGVRGARIQQICAASGVSVGSIYHHFDGTQGIAAAAYRREMEDLLVTVREAMLARRTARTSVFALVDAYLGWVQRNPDRARFIYWAAAEIDADAHRGIAQFKVDLLAPMMQRVRAYVEAGRVRALPPAYYEVVVIGQLAEFCRRWLMAGPGLDIAEARRVLRRSTWAALAP
jgi:AcrR family transcriptional regulator